MLRWRLHYTQTSGNMMKYQEWLSLKVYFYKIWMFPCYHMLFLLIHLLFYPFLRTYLELVYIHSLNIKFLPMLTILLQPGNFKILFMEDG